MNIYGWSQDDFVAVVGSKNSSLIEKASAILSASLREPTLAKGQAWLRKLIMEGYPFRSEHKQPSEPEDGGLWTMQMETEAHAITMYCIARAISRDEHLNLASDSSYWSHPSVEAFYREAQSCQFPRSKDCPREYYTWMHQLGNGTPVFGDEFRSAWCFYTLFSNDELKSMIPVFQAAVDFERTLPEGIPPEIARHAQSMPDRFSDSGKNFARDLVKWFEQIQKADQDAFILWR
jgi:hypothetical protein